MERVHVSGITMAGVRSPLFVRLGRRGLGQKVPAAGELKDISLDRITATGALWPSVITGIPGHLISNISLNDIRITGRGGAKAARLGNTVRELEAEYPDATRFRDLPSYGLYFRHVQGLRTEELHLETSQPDARPALVLDDVWQADLHAMAAASPADGGPVFWLRSVRDGRLRGLRPGVGTKALVRLSGHHTARIRLEAHGSSPFAHAVLVDPDVDASAVQLEQTLTQR